MDVAKTYAVVTLFRLLSPQLQLLQFLFAIVAHGSISFTRINSFLNLPSSDVIKEDSKELPIGQIQIENGNFCCKDIELQKKMGDKDIALHQQVI